MMPITCKNSHSYKKLNQIALKLITTITFIICVSKCDATMMYVNNILTSRALLFEIIDMILLSPHQLYNNQRNI